MLRVHLPDDETITLISDPQMTVEDLISQIADKKWVSKKAISCYSSGELLLPFVHLKGRNDIKIYFNTESEPKANKQRSHSPLLGMRRVTKCGIECKVNGKRLYMILDTGASISILYRNQVQFLGMESQVCQSEEFHISFSTVGGGIASSIGRLSSLALIVGNTETKASFAVLETSCHYGLLGMDWLLSNDVVINFCDQCMNFENDKIQFQDFW
jgi:hypothetical protein